MKSALMRLILIINQELTWAQGTINNKWKLCLLQERTYFRRVVLFMKLCWVFCAIMISILFSLVSVLNFKAEY